MWRISRVEGQAAADRPPAPTTVPFYLGQYVVWGIGLLAAVGAIALLLRRAAAAGPERWPSKRSARRGDSSTLELVRPRLPSGVESRCDGSAWATPSAIGHARGRLAKALRIGPPWAARPSGRPIQQGRDRARGTEAVPVGDAPGPP